ncbi:MAG: heavy-metal-associated domain-containing protein [Planctomycetales bacterium]|nr:heavy-metal-associated domain-containing protein [Planctomycetales bacterium]
MRSVAYVVAILAAAGIMYFIATSPDQRAADQVADTTEHHTASVSAAGSVSADAAIEDVSAESIVPEAEVKTASLTMNVPEMHCPFACYPSVKKNLEERDDVMAVELAPQKEEGVIDNPQVIVTYKEGFDAEQAIAMLEAAGFAGSTVVDQ